MSVFRRVRDSGIGQLPRWSVEDLNDAQLKGWRRRFCRDGFGPAQIQVLAEKHSFHVLGETTGPLHPISNAVFKLASTSEYRRSPPSLTLETSRPQRQLKAEALQSWPPSDLRVRLVCCEAPLFLESPSPPPPDDSRATSPQLLVPSLAPLPTSPTTTSRPTRLPRTASWRAI